MDVRWYATVVVSGLVLPILTVFVALRAAIGMEFPPQLTFVVMLAVPLLAIVSTYAMAIYSGLSVPFEDRLPVGGGRQFRDQVPEHYHDTFAPETLEAPATTSENGPNTIVTAYLVYLVSVPVYTLVVWLLLSP
jgi:hypothetical protein